MSSDTRQAAAHPTTFDTARIRADFPILGETVRGRRLTYLDNAATTQKPRAVIDAIRHYYEAENANIHRGVHFLSQNATIAYENVRRTVRDFIHAEDDSEIVFVRGTTEAVNLVASSYGRHFLSEGDEIVVTHMEHHSNIVPWQLLAEQVGATIRVAPINDRGEVILEEYEALLGKRTKIVAMAHVSNALGTINPVKRMAEMAHANGAIVLVDGAQAAAHLPVDVIDLGADFYTLSGHKMFGPTGVGALYGRRELLEKMPPYQGGGDMILSVSFDGTVFNKIPQKFEAGTPNIAGVIGFGKAIEYIERCGLEAIGAHEDRILAAATACIAALPGIKLVGTAQEKAGILGFTIENVHPHDIGTILDQEGVAIRAGHHCAQPVMERFGVPATVRASFAMYNDETDVDHLVASLDKVMEIFG